MISGIAVSSPVQEPSGVSDVAMVYPYAPKSLDLNTKLIGSKYKAKVNHHSTWIKSDRFRAKREQLTMLSRPVPESPGQNMAVTILYMPCSRDSAPALMIHPNS